VAHQAILFILDVLIRNNQAMPMVKLYDSFADRTFTPQMLRAVGGNEQGLQQFLLRYPSLFTVNNDTRTYNQFVIKISSKSIEIHCITRLE
jgi:hypothetical protein